MLPDTPCVRDNNSPCNKGAEGKLVLDWVQQSRPKHCTVQHVCVLCVMTYREILCNVCICRLGTTMIGCSACRCTGHETQSESSWAGHN